MTDMIDAGVMAQVARNCIEAHEEWDSFHHLLVITRDPGNDGCVAFPLVAGIDPSLPPELYPVLAGKVTSESGERPYALCLQVEAFGVKQGPLASAAEQAQLDADRRSRSIHTRPDAQEVAIAILADVHGRTWTVTKFRESGEVLEEAFSPGGDSVYGGRFITGLRDALRLFGEQA